MKLFGPLLLLCLILTFPLSGREFPTPLPGSIIVQLKPGTRPESLENNPNTLTQRSLSLRHYKPLSPHNRIYLFHFDPDQDPNAVLQRIRQWSGVAAAQLDYELSPRATPNDTHYGDQWDLERIGMAAAWDITTGGVTARGDTIVVAITDAGFNPDHKDIAPNLWVNRAEIPNDSIDNDQNGYIDDEIGWNFNQSTNVHPTDSHGQRVAGIIGARGNNGFGTAGINWQVKLMLLTTTRISGLIEAYDYMIEQRRRYNDSDGQEGAFVVATNLSLGLSRTFCDEQPVWGSMYDRLGEVGILAGVAAANENYNADQLGDMPLTCTSDYILAVTNMTRMDQKYIEAAYGTTSVDVGAPGEGTVTIDLFDDFSVFGGSSAAAPHVTGAIALLYSLPCEYLAADALQNPAPTALAIRNALLEGVDLIPDLADKTATGGRINIFRSLQLLSSGCSSSIGELDLIKLYPNPTLGPVTLEMQTPDFKEYELIVSNPLGQVVYREQFSPLRLDPKKKTIDLGNLAAGIYTLSLANGKKWVSKKLVVR